MLTPRIIYESDILNGHKWCEKLNISNQEFEKLLTDRVFSQIENDLYRNDFVGTIKLQNELLYSLPKFFIKEQINDIKTLQNIIILIEKSLTTYKNRVNNSKAIKAGEDFYMSVKHLKEKTEFDLYIVLKENYLKGGLFRKTINIYQEKRSFINVDWQRTINSSKPIHSDNAPIYINPISKKKLLEDNKITRIHYSVLSFLTKKYHFFSKNINIDSILKSENIEVISENELRRDSSYWINIINIELRSTFKDDLKNTLFALKEFFEKINNRAKNNINLFGTSYFYIIWEDALRVITKDAYSLFKGDIAQPVYYLSNGKNQIDRQKPDILVEKGEIFYIIDAKYYVLSLSRPGWGDVVKQFFYKKSFLPTKQYDKVENLFFVPNLLHVNEASFKEDNKYLGKILVEKDENVILDFPAVRIFGLNPIKVFTSYVKNYPEELEFMQLLALDPD